MTNGRKRKFISCQKTGGGKYRRNIQSELDEEQFQFIQ